MNLLNEITLKKETKELALNVYKEDAEVFEMVLTYLQKKAGNRGTYTQEDLFEHIMKPLSQDKKLLEDITPKKRAKKTKIVSAAKNPQKNQGAAKGESFATH